MEYVTYIRTSTKSQNNGLEAQQQTIDQFVANNGGSVVATFVEQVSGAKNDRAELNKALALCKRTGATLLVAKLDRLSRRVSFVAALMESNIKFKVAEMPDADEFMLHVHISCYSYERQMISKRTKQALAVLKDKGVKLGSPLNPIRAERARNFANIIKPHVEQLRKDGVTSWHGMASALNERGITSATGGKWYQKTLQRCMGYAEA